MSLNKLTEAGRKAMGNDNSAVFFGWAAVRCRDKKCADTFTEYDLKEKPFINHSLFNG